MHMKQFYLEPVYRLMTVFAPFPMVGFSPSSDPDPQAQSRARSAGRVASLQASNSVRRAGRGLERDQSPPSPAASFAFLDRVFPVGDPDHHGEHLHPKGVAHAEGDCTHECFALSQFFFRVTDTGSWLEIGSSITNFVICSLLGLFSSVLLAGGEYLLAHSVG